MYFCCYCEFKDYKFNEVEKHSYKQHPELQVITYKHGDYQYPCKFCHKYKKRLLTHMRYYCKENPVLHNIDTFYCSVCRRNPSMSYLSSHLVQHGYDKEEQRCLNCFKKFNYSHYAHFLHHARYCDLHFTSPNRSEFSQKVLFN